MLDSVWAVVTSFRPTGLGQTVQRIRLQTRGVVVVDDGSGPVFSDELTSAREAGADVIALAENAGIAAALNTGIARAFELGADAVVTFDQDSSIGPSFIASLVGTHNSEADCARMGPVVPQFFADVAQATKEDARGRLLAENAIQSGMLIPRAVVEVMGPFREDFFIDLVDTEFELRCRAAGRPVRAVRGLRLEHRLGARYVPDNRALRLLSPVTLSAPFRYYYRARNRILLERAFARRFPGPLLRAALMDRLHFLLALLIARPRREMWAVLCAGGRDARRGVGGRAPGRVLDRAQTVRWAAERVPES